MAYFLCRFLLFFERKEKFYGFKALYDEKRSMVLAELNAALAGVDAGQVRRLIDALEGAEKVFFVGVGRVMLSLQAIAETASSIWGFDTYGGEAKPRNHPSAKGSSHCGIGQRRQSLVPSAARQKPGALARKIAHIGCIPDNPISHHRRFHCASCKE